MRREKGGNGREKQERGGRRRKRGDIVRQVEGAERGIEGEVVLMHNLYIAHPTIDIF